MKRRSVDCPAGACWATTEEVEEGPPKRVASDTHRVASATLSRLLNSGVSAQGGSLCASEELWRLVAEQVQSALESLPGWAQVADSQSLSGSAASAASSFASAPATTTARPILAAPTSAQHQRRNSHQDAVLAGASSSLTATDLPSNPAPAAAAGGASSTSPLHAAVPDSCPSDADTATSFGWFAKCRGCCCLTAGEVELQASVVPLCRTCAGALSRRGLHEREGVVLRLMRAHATLCQREAAQREAAGAAS